MHEVVDLVLGHLKAAWRYRWYAIGVAWVVAIVGWIVVYKMPNRYEASARVYVDTQSVLRPLLSGLAVQPNFDQQVAMMSRTLISRPNLEKVIRMSDMDIKLKTPEEREALMAQLTKNLEIRSTGRENLYTIAFADQNPQQAKRVVQSLLTIFVEGSLGDKRKDTDNARRFLDEQLKAYNDKLVAAENAITEFKRKHVGLMPGTGGGFYSKLGEAQSAVRQAELELKEAEFARDAIKRQLSGESDDMPSLLDNKAGPAPEPANPEIDARIAALQQKLDGLRLTYTDRHPDIIAINRVIDQLKEQKKAELKLRKPLTTTAGGQLPQNPIQQQLAISLTGAEATVASMKARVDEYQRRYESLKTAVNAAPQIEAEYTQLTRDYNVNKSNYENLLSRRESAQISGEMESSTNVLDFRVIDPPTVPSMPSAPDRAKLMSIVMLIALGAGVAVAFLLSQIRPTFSDEKRLRELSGLPVFGTVVMAWTDGQRSKRRKNLIALLLSFMSLLSAYGTIMAALTLR